MGMMRSGALAAFAATVGCYSGSQRTPEAEGGGSDEAGDDGGSGSDDDGEASCVPEPSGRATLRRMTRFEYNNTIRDLLGDTSLPANALPSEELANGFGNDADAQSVSSLLAEQYNTIADDIAQRATANADALGALAPCAADITASTDAATVDACAEQLIADVVQRAYRRPLVAGEAEELTALAREIRAQTDFATSIAAVIEAVLQSPDFLYRVEHGVVDDDGQRRPTGYEMASRLSYLMWSTMPDGELLRAAADGELDDAEGVLAQAERLLADERSHATIRFFFDNLLPISSLAALERDPELYPAFSAQVGAAMREETQRLLQYEIFEGSGTWDGALTAPYTFVNGALAEFYGIEGVTGDEFVRVDTDPTQRLGVLTHAGVVAGTIHSNETNPVVRGAFVMRNLMCTQIPLPEGDVLDEVKPPDPGSGATARERFSQHSEDPVCAGCHSLMDPVGLPFENYDAVGRWRDTENGVTIDASGALPGLGDVNNAVQLVQLIADSDAAHACFAVNWTNFAYGRSSGPEDQCTLAELTEQFEGSGHDIGQLLLDLTQTDDFLTMPEEG